MKHQLLLLSMLSLALPTHSALAASPGTGIWDIAADIKELTCTIESQVCELGLTDFSGTFSMIDTIIEQQSTMSTQIDEVKSDLEQVSFDFDGTYTAIEAVKELACTISSELDNPISFVDIIEQTFGFPITNEVVGTTGFTITVTGEYYLAEDIFFEPSSTGLTAITIDSDDIFFNFIGRSLTTDGTADTIGIEMIGTHTNILLENGTIADTDAQCILIDGELEDIVIRDMSILNAANSSGIEVANARTNLFFNNVRIGNCNQNGLLIDDVSSIVVERCTSDNNGNGTGNGMLFTNCFDTVVRNCTAHDNSNSGIAFSSTSTSDGIEVFDCFTSDNGDHGILFSHLDGAAIRDSFSERNGLDGIHLEDTTGTSLINNVCQNNGRDNIRLATDSTGTHNCYVGLNTLVLTTSVNLTEEVGSSQNMALGNFALATNSANNYVSIGGGSFFNQETVSQSGSFPMPKPTFWNNISMTT